MDPNTNQPLGTTQTTQPAEMPAQPVPVGIPTPGVSPVNPNPIPMSGSQQPPIPTVMASASTPENPKGKSKKAITLLIILLLLAVGIVIYILFAKNQISNNQKGSSNNSTIVAPEPTSIPTLTPEEELQVSSPEAEFLQLEASVKEL